MPLFVEAIMLRLAMLARHEGEVRRRLLEPVPTRAELRAIFAARRFVAEPHQSMR
ncbi:MAG TPA: hypothetical protein VGV07_19785 [Devosia sp.]|jgi:hypothetical protein|uniref:hypothetical protein n=1 Tax=Devosia sp. TaxID=1871048 RepID=UPI002DDD30E8|nr:hypothetical protein [Devosia sp.]HEV2517505.1 hypothetical protein [Devosia sp.]